MAESAPTASRIPTIVAELARLALVPGERLTDALSDPARRQRAMVLAAIGYALIWTLYAIVSKSSHDLHPDLT
jgi:hypothetical protein